jgi:hypothetical protein
MKEAIKVIVGSIVFALLMCASYKAKADQWAGGDKTMHFAVGVGIASAVTLATDSPANGFAVGAAAGLAKEFYDAQHRNRHTPNLPPLPFSLDELEPA